MRAQRHPSPEPSAESSFESSVPSAADALISSLSILAPPMLVGAGVRSSDLVVMNHLLAKNLSLCLFKSCATIDFQASYILYHSLQYGIRAVLLILSTIWSRESLMRAFPKFDAITRTTLHLFLNMTLYHA